MSEARAMGMRADGSEFRGGEDLPLDFAVEAATNELQVIPLAPAHLLYVTIDDAVRVWEWSLRQLLLKPQLLASLRTVGP